MKPLMIKWWEHIIIRLFGKKIISYTDGFKMISYHYKGKIYITKYE